MPLVARVSALERLVASNPGASRNSSAASWVLATGWLSFGNQGFSQIEDDVNSRAVTLNSLIRPCWSVYAIVLSTLSTTCKLPHPGQFPGPSRLVW
uniref:Glycosyltransferase QUASIMODO1, putative n=1 Tax=Arundo donax TaxID=35708 RepID=A0A0A9F2I2_ARUDO